MRTFSISKEELNEIKDFLNELEEASVEKRVEIDDSVKLSKENLNEEQLQHFDCIFELIYDDMINMTDQDNYKKTALYTEVIKPYIESADKNKDNDLFEYALRTLFKQAIHDIKSEDNLETIDDIIDEYLSNKVHNLIKTFGFDNENIDYKSLLWNYITSISDDCEIDNNIYEEDEDEYEDILYEDEDVKLYYDENGVKSLIIKTDDFNIIPVENEDKKEENAEKIINNFLKNFLEVL